MSTRVCARVAERAAFGVGVVEDRVAVAAGADVEVGVGHVVGVDLRVEPGAGGVRGEDPVGAKRRSFFVEGRRGRQEGAAP